MSDINLSDRRLWLQYCSSAQACENLGIVETTTHNFNLKTYGHHHETYSMLSIYELSLLFALAKDIYKGWGYIIDAGSLLGVTTFALAKGLSENTIVEDKKR